MNFWFHFLSQTLRKTSRPKAFLNTKATSNWSILSKLLPSTFYQDKPSSLCEIYSLYLNKFSMSIQSRFGISMPKNNFEAFRHVFRMYTAGLESLSGSFELIWKQLFYQTCTSFIKLAHLFLELLLLINLDKLWLDLSPWPQSI